MIVNGIKIRTIRKDKKTRKESKSNMEKNNRKNKGIILMGGKNNKRSKIETSIIKANKSQNN
jgi:hypothetical protein